MAENGVERGTFISALVVLIIAIIFLVLANRALRARNDLRNILDANSAVLPVQVYAQGMKDTDDMFGLLKAVQVISAIEIALFILGFLLLVFGGSYLFYKFAQQAGGPSEAEAEAEAEAEGRSEGVPIY
jgi:hypothetical protein